MYSPAALPSRQRAAPAKKRKLSAITGISSFVAASIGLPALSASSFASSAPCSSTRSASASSTSARSRRRRLRPGLERVRRPPRPRRRLPRRWSAARRPSARRWRGSGRRSLSPEPATLSPSMKLLSTPVVAAMSAPPALVPLSGSRARGRHAERLGDRRVDDLAAVDVEPEAQARVLLERLVDAASASSITYGIVAFVSAYVEVIGTAPGMFATQ